ncbi:MAG: pseudouridine synthase [bacterium]
MRVRLNRFLSRAGVASRRRADDLLLEGRVFVNGKPVVKPGLIIDIEKDIVEVDSRIIYLPEIFIYVAFNKPKGVLTTLRQKGNRPTIGQYISSISTKLNIGGGLVYVGRLDYDTRGLILLTNDGNFAYKVSHPKYEVEKEYIVSLIKRMRGKYIKQIEDGIQLEDDLIKPSILKYVGRKEGLFRYSIVVKEGRNRLVRRIFQKFDYSIVDLVRVRIGTIELGDLAEGEWRVIEPEKVFTIFNKSL